LSNVLVIGLGNEFRGDDAVGVAVARRLRKQLPKEIAVIEHGGDGASLIEIWSGAVCVYLIDAVKSGAKAGTIHRLNAGSEPIPTSFSHYSTHGFSLAEAVEVARGLGQLPPHLFIYGIEGAVFDHGAPMSPEVEDSAQIVQQELTDELS
jgi:hydrogenase maturation protease